MTVGVPRESFPGERRVALVPASASPLMKLGLQMLVERGAGTEAGFSDNAYSAAGAQLVDTRQDVFARADVLAQVRSCGANPTAGRKDLELLRTGQIVVATCEPLAEPQWMREAARTGAVCFALELVPRITRAQSMDVLSSMATIAGYKAVLLAAGTLPRMFPMLMTAAGTVTPARVFVVGAGVAGLQAIATAKRLGAVVRAYDIRPAVREQVESVGGRFVELPLETGQAEAAGGYARAMDEDFYRRQREMMGKVVAESDVVITTAAVPGKKAPLLVTREMISGMAAGSVVVDLAAERGGNCEPTQPGETVKVDGVMVLGPANLPAEVPYHASEMFSRNMVSFLKNLVRGGRPALDADDEIIRETMITRGGEVVHERVRDLLGERAQAAALPGGQTPLRASDAES
ncbi:MAG: Re/Si-specific NAD(P)(+) transhydrogenase subunit alpha [Planctomycetes bacterium]|nr:Re/Si-specific NAD(P)(+) transhydrogenase subunit alpha [Planctomycetota bacterium]